MQHEKKKTALISKLFLRICGRENDDTRKKACVFAAKIPFLWKEVLTNAAIYTYLA